MRTDIDLEMEAQIAPQAVPEYLEGYRDFSEFIASDKEFFIYRRFDGLTARNLLYYQAEMQVLENKLDEMDQQDNETLKKRDDQAKKLEEDERCWELFVHMAKGGDSRAVRRLELIHELRKRTKEYEEALIRRSQILALAEPSSGALNGFGCWFKKRNPFRGECEYLLDQAHDLVALAPRSDNDRLSFFLHQRLGFYIRDVVKLKSVPESWRSTQLYYYSGKRITWIANVISVVVAAIMLICPIAALHSLRGISPRLAILAGFTLMFAVAVGLVTNARRVEIFASTAAYAAVLVVFIGTNS